MDRSGRPSFRPGHQGVVVADASIVTRAEESPDSRHQISTELNNCQSRPRPRARHLAQDIAAKEGRGVNPFQQTRSSGRASQI